MLQNQQLAKHPLNSIYFYLTEGCNLRCRHCWIEPKYQSEKRSYPSLPLELFRSILEQAKPLGLSSVKLTGGEPLLHPQIREILEVIRCEDVRLMAETNGVLCSTELAEKMAACKDPSVSVSLDGANAETHEWMRGVKGCFEAALEGTSNLVKAGFKPQLIMSVARRNKDEMESLVRLGESLGASSVKFNLVQPVARGERMHKDGDTLSVEELLELGRWVEDDLSARTTLRVYFDQPLAFRPLGKMFGENGNGCSRCRVVNIIGVLANGFYAMCGIGEVVPGLVYGNAASDSLLDVWTKNPVLLELREGLPGKLEGICSQCAFKHRCRGNCVAQNYYRSGSLWSCHWFCDRASEKGLFPESRLISRKASSIPTET